MNKKIIIAFFFVCVVSIITLLLIFLKKQNVESNSSVFNMIPPSSVLIFEINSYDNFIATQDGNDMWNKLKTINYFSELDSKLSTIDSLVRTNNMYSIINDHPIILSMHLLGNTTYEFLFLMSLENDEEVNDFQNSMFELLDKQNVRSRIYNEQTIYDITIGKDNQSTNISMAMIDKSVVLGLSPVIVESAIRQNQSGEGLQNDEAFQKVRRTAGKFVDINVFANYDLLPVFVSSLMSDKLKVSYKKNKNLASWSALDLNLKSDYALLNGFVATNADRDYLNLFSEQSAVNFEIYNFLPANTSMFWSFGFSDFSKFLNDYKMYLSESESLEAHKMEIDKLQNVFDVDVVETFSKICDKEIAAVFTEINTLDVLENSFVVMQTKSRSLAEEQMLGILDSYATKAGIDYSQLVYEYKLDDETNYKIYRMPEKRVPSAIFGRAFSFCESNYFTFFDNYIIFGNSIKSIGKYIHSMLLKKSLSNDSGFKAFYNKLANDYNFYTYVNIPKAYELLPEFFNNKIKSSILQNRDVYKTFESVGYQIQSNKGRLYTNLFLKYNPVNENMPHTVWESFLDTLTNFKPKLVDMHNTSEKAILVQDKMNNLYMLNKEGRILWKKYLSEPINSEIYTIDFYKNGKLQYAFSTASQLYVIDRVGNFVEHYPIKLPSKTVAGMSLFDYDANRTYRIVVPCEDKFVYLYDADGKTIKGWEFGKTDNVVTTPVQHIRFGDSDYLLIADKYNIYIVDRRGKSRVQLAEKFEKSPRNIFYKANIEGKDCFLTTDVDGSVKHIYLDGSVKTSKLRKSSPEHFFSYQDIDGDNQGDYLYLDKDELFALSQSGKRIFKYSFDNNIEAAPIAYQFAQTDVKIGIVDYKSSKIYLINNNGKLYNGFPLTGNSQFSIGHFNSASRRFNLLVGGKDNFLYNYEVK